METPDPKYKHKPSEKHTLEEVLKSLQDLIRNDLIESTGEPKTPAAEALPSDAAPPKAPEPKPRRESVPGTREDFAPVSPGSGPVNLDAVMRSLKDLIGNELDVGGEPAPVNDKPASRHDEYFSTEEKIEEYVPEGLADLDAELTITDEHAGDVTEAAPSHNELSMLEEITAEGLLEDLTPLDEEITLETPVELAPPPAAPQDNLDVPVESTPEMVQSTVEPAAEEFTPLDEELTFEDPLEPEPAPAIPTSTAEIPGEISPELLEEPAAPPPAAVASTPAPEADLVPGTQHEMFPEDASLPTPEPETVTADPAPATTMEPAPAPELQPPAEEQAQPAEATPESVAEALPTIDVEENFEDNDYFSAAPSAETAPPASESEETIALDAEIPSQPEIVAAPATEPAPAPPSPEISAAPAEPAGEKITLAIADEPAQKKPHDEYTVDFDSSDLAPPLAEESDLVLPETSATNPSAEDKPQNCLSVDYDSSDLSPPLAEESDLAPPEASMTIQDDTTAEATEAGTAPEPDEATAPEPEPPATEPKAGTPAETELTPPAQETAEPEAPVSFNHDDIPILNEIVAPPAGGVPTAEPTAPAPKSPLPAPDRAREIVVRAVAKLNVEMRKTGGAGLDTKTILRLQQLIRQELEKGGGK